MTARNSFSDFLRRHSGLPDPGSLPPKPEPSSSEIQTIAPTNRKIFIVHGHDGGLLQRVARFIAEAKYEPIILSEKSVPGRALLDEFIDKAKNLRFGIIIATADDWGRSMEETVDKLRARARQNVIFEWGYLLHALGSKKVAVLHDESVEMPSDYKGMIYIPINNSTDWIPKLGKAMRAAGLSVDLNKVSY